MTERLDTKLPFTWAEVEHHGFTAVIDNDGTIWARGDAHEWCYIGVHGGFDEDDDERPYLPDEPYSYMKLDEGAVQFLTRHLIRP